ncbi:MAG: class I SAM-dependent methyltransferase [Candidatus Krumholzibacteria bacterium]|nr:class I SAM-dependent methyltransferase [Candidatus Krumholzibacteria bacterium]
MKNTDTWRPSKYVMTAKGLRGSRDKTEVGVGSRLVADLAAQAYESALREHATGLLLDLGCGKVPLFGVYRQYVSDNICVDWENSVHHNEWLDLEHDLNVGIPFADDHFDTILSTDVLEHVHNPHSLWREMARVLKPSGKVIVGVPFLYAIHEEPHDYFRYTEYALRHLCETSGLRVIALEPYGGLADTILTMIARAAATKPLAGLAARAVMWIGGSRLGAVVREKTKRRYPPGYCLIGEKGA